MHTPYMTPYETRSMLCEKVLPVTGGSVPVPYRYRYCTVPGIKRPMCVVDGVGVSFI
jgi:hypothetical protein